MFELLSEEESEERILDDNGTWTTVSHNKKKAPKRHPEAAPKNLAQAKLLATRDFLQTPEQLALAEEIVKETADLANTYVHTGPNPRAASRAAHEAKERERKTARDQAAGPGTSQPGPGTSQRGPGTSQQGPGITTGPGILQQRPGTTTGSGISQQGPGTATGAGTTTGPPAKKAKTAAIATTKATTNSAAKSSTPIILWGRILPKSRSPD